MTRAQAIDSKGPNEEEACLGLRTWIFLCLVMPLHHVFLHRPSKRSYDTKRKKGQA